MMLRVLFGVKAFIISWLLMSVAAFQVGPSSSPKTRADFLRSSAAAASGWFVATTVGTSTVKPAHANSLQEKLLNLPDDKLKAIIQRDVGENQYLCNGRLTRSVYDESATFTDEIDTYQMDQWIKGTQKLFVGENSQVRLVGDVDVTPSAVTFRFDEELQFRIPFLFPTVALTGKVILKRDPSTGLITSYQEFWDQDVATVLKSAKFNLKL